MGLISIACLLFYLKPAFDWNKCKCSGRCRRYLWLPIGLTPLQFTPEINSIFYIEHEHRTLLKSYFTVVCVEVCWSIPPHNSQRYDEHEMARCDAARLHASPHVDVPWQNNFRRFGSEWCRWVGILSKAAATSIDDLFSYDFSLQKKKK